MYRNMYLYIYVLYIYDYEYVWRARTRTFSFKPIKGFLGPHKFPGRTVHAPRVGTGISAHRIQRNWYPLVTIFAHWFSKYYAFLAALPLMFYLLSDIGGLLPNPVQARESVFCFVELLRHDPKSRHTCATWGTRILQTGSCLSPRSMGYFCCPNMMLVCKHAPIGHAQFVLSGIHTFGHTHTFACYRVMRLVWW